MAHKACYKLVKDMHYKGRVQTIITYNATYLGAKINKTNARNMRTDPETISVGSSVVVCSYGGQVVRPGVFALSHGYAVRLAAARPAFMPVHHGDSFQRSGVWQLLLEEEAATSIAHDDAHA